MYFNGIRYFPTTGEIDNLPLQRVVDQNGFRQLPRVDGPFVRWLNIPNFRTMESQRA